MEYQLSLRDVTKRFGDANVYRVRLDKGYSLKDKAQNVGMAQMLNKRERQGCRRPLTNREKGYQEMRCWEHTLDYSPFLQ